MTNQKPTTERELLLFLKESVNSKEEYEWVCRELAELDSRSGSRDSQGGENMKKRLVCPHCRDGSFIRRHDVVVRVYADGNDIAIEATRELEAWPLQCATCFETVAVEELVASGGPRPVERLKGGAL